MAEFELISVAGGEVVLHASDRKNGDSILYWVEDYWDKRVAGKPEGTRRAKKIDLELFLAFFSVLRTDDIELWTPSVSEQFVSWLATSNPTKPNRSEGKHQEAYAPSSINRTLATLRHFANHVSKKRIFDNPLEGVNDFVLDDPEWNGLDDLSLMRLRAALDVLTREAKRGQQMPLRNRAAFLLALNTGLRVGEVSALDFSQLDLTNDNPQDIEVGRYLRNVKGKGRRSTEKVYVSKNARPAIEQYIQCERGTEPGPLFTTNRGGRMSRQQLDRFFRQVMKQANSKLSPGEKEIVLHGHKLRHTGVKKIYVTKGPVEAKKFARHASFKQLERYAAQNDDEREEMVDNMWISWSPNGQH